MKNNQERLYESIFGTSLSSEQEQRERIKVFLESLPENSEIEIDEEELEKALSDNFYHKRAMAEHVLSLYQEYFPTLPEIEFVFYNGGKVNIENQKNNIYITDNWILFFRDVLVLLSSLEFTLQQKDNEGIGDNYLNLLICIDTFCYRGKSGTSPYSKEIDVNIKKLNGHFQELANLLFSIFAFAICHELSHIVLNHQYEENDKRQREYEADSHAYIMFLKLIEQFQNGETSHPMAISFQHYVACAPAIFMRIYEMIASFLYIVYNQKQSIEYPTFKQRENSLKRIVLGDLSIVEEYISNIPLYKLDNESNELSQLFYDEIYTASEFFITETALKKQRGKLKSIENM